MYRTSMLLAIMTMAVLWVGCSPGEESSMPSSGTSTNAGSANATRSPGGNSATTSMLSSSDKTFIANAAQGGMAEVELGKLAVAKAQNPDVRKFGQRMVDDHTKANNELRRVAEEKNVTLPSDLSPDQKALKDKLSKLSGPAFDKKYMQEMVKDHETDVKEFQDESASAKDPGVKNFASKTLPTLEEHLQMARDANSKLK
jgi:putative membrane protein